MKIFLFQNDGDIGDIFQDEGNMAAILVREHPESGDLLMVSFSDNLSLISKQSKLRSEKKT